jgi:division protein CdvB (Snf7/Vps24/ESCRT-III family)
MSLDNLSDTQQTRIKEFMKQGMKLKLEVQDINEALKDLAKTIGDEIQVKPADLSKALNAACKGSEQVENMRDSNSTVEEILAIAGII